MLSQRSRRDLHQEQKHQLEEPWKQIPVDANRPFFQMMKERQGCLSGLRRTLLNHPRTGGVDDASEAQSPNLHRRRDLASRDAVDQAAPNAKLCASMGASAMAFDQRVFVSFNPFNVYVAQADVKPACVLRPANVVPILQARHLINDNEVRACKANMNTWAFVGDLEDQPQLSCVYKSEDAQNEFLSNPKFGIGEDYLDDDRDVSRVKQVKAGMTGGQKEALRRQAASIPGLD